MHLWCHTSTMMMMTSKNMKKWPTAAGYKQIKNSNFHIIQHWPSKRCSINDCCLWIKKSKRNHAKIHLKNSKKNKARLRSQQQKKNSIYKWAASFYLMNISMPNNDRTGGTLFWIIHQKRCHTDITCSQKPKNNSFLFLKKTTILLQFYYNESDLFSKLYVTVYDSILTYLLTT